MSWNIFFPAIVLILCLGACGEAINSPASTGQVVLEVSYAKTSEHPPDKWQKISQIVALMTQDGTIVEQRDLRAEEGQWTRTLAVKAGNYTVTLEAYEETKVTWRGSRPVMVRANETVPVRILLATTNLPPNADAGLDQTVEVGTKVQLDGKNSRDPDGANSSLTYQWTPPPGITLENSMGRKTGFTPSAPGIYSFLLVVHDGADASRADEVKVRVLELGSDIIRMTLPAGSKHEMVLVPAGEFSFGMNFEQEQWIKAMGWWWPEFANEKPLQTAYLDAFYIDRYEVTNAQWNAYARIQGKSTKLGADNEPGPDDHPVVWISWFEARDYCAWAGMRLPTEIEWEKAARGTDKRSYPWGEGIDDDKANHWWNGDGAMPVGKFPQGVSPHGAYDMAGNIWEWTSTLYRSYPYDATDGRENPDENALDRVHRGGAWGCDPVNLRTSRRTGFSPGGRLAIFGFRCARSL